MRLYECNKKLEKIVRETLDNAGIVKIISYKNEFKSKPVLMKKFGYIPDLIIKVKTRDNKIYTLFVEIKSIGQPRYIRMAALQLQSYILDKKKSYGVISAPYLTEESIKICRENGCGFIDLAGNSLLQFDNIYINIRGKQNPYPSTRELKSLFAIKSTRALRVLLCNPKKNWTVQDLAGKSGISLGQAFNIKKKLLDNEYIQLLKNKNFILAKSEELIKKWAENYSFDEINEIEKKIKDYCELNKILYAFTLTSGSSLVAPVLRYKRVFVYIEGSVDKIEKILEWKEVPTGPNITVLKPYDDGVFYGLQSINKINVVSNVQLFLDLQGYKERGEEAAEFILQNRLKKIW